MIFKRYIDQVRQMDLADPDRAVVVAAMPHCAKADLWVTKRTHFIAALIDLAWFLTALTALLFYAQWIDPESRGLLPVIGALSACFAFASVCSKGLTACIEFRKALRVRYDWATLRTLVSPQEGEPHAKICL